MGVDAITSRGLRKTYGAVTAVSGIDLGIRTGEVYGFLGPNGSGKTSTIMMLLGASRPTAGEITLFGEPFTAERLDLRARIGVVPEKHPRGMWRWMTAVEYLNLFADIFGVPNRRRRIADMLERVDLAHASRRRIAGFSRGMMQKLSVVRALLHDPDLLFLDEPISGLDPMGIKQVRDLILAERREGRTIFISSHLLSEVERICDRVGIIFRGRLLAEDSLPGLLRRAGPSKRVEIELEEVPDGLAADVTSLASVKTCSLEDRTLVLEVSAEGDARREVSAWLISRGLLPVRIQEVGRTLEELFMEITSENVQQLASGEHATEAPGG